MKKGNTKNLVNFPNIFTVFYCPILMIVIALILPWKKGV